LQNLYGNNLGLDFNGKDAIAFRPYFIVNILFTGAGLRPYNGAVSVERATLNMENKINIKML
jgi:hypothetical protein